MIKEIPLQANGKDRGQVTVRKKKYPLVLHADVEDGGFWVECPEIPGCVSQGDTVEEALTIIKDAIKGCLACKPIKAKFAKAL